MTSYSTAVGDEAVSSTDKKQREHQNGKRQKEDKPVHICIYLYRESFHQLLLKCNFKMVMKKQYFSYNLKITMYPVRFLCCSFHRKLIICRYNRKYLEL